MKQYLGIDYGAARIGLAIADDETRLAQPLKTVTLPELKTVIAAEGPFAALVVGLPRNLDGSDTPQTVAVRRFTDDHLGNVKAEVVFMDEAGTSALAEERLIESGRKYTKEQIDAEAAALILQDYLNAL